MRKLMEQAQQVQSQLAAAQEELSAKTYQGTAGGGAVTVLVSGAGRLVSVDFEPTVLDPEDPEMAGDLVVAAANQAFTAATEDAANSIYLLCIPESDWITGEVINASGGVRG